VIIKKTITIILHFAIANTLIIIVYSIYPYYYHWAIGLFCYLIINLIFYRVIPNKHIKGLINLAKADYKTALKDFEKSHLFFSKHNFFDRYGFIFLLKMSRYSYREAALLNMAFINYKIGNIEEALKLYEKVLSINSENRIAKKGIKIVEL
tara:strand:- start:836 stop:1288 length:453 start_codon:yes stop_codon:yes gene_type:complete